MNEELRDYIEKTGIPNNCKNTGKDIPDVGKRHQCHKLKELKTQVERSLMRTCTADGTSPPPRYCTKLSGDGAKMTRLTGFVVISFSILDAGDAVMSPKDCKPSWRPNHKREETGSSEKGQQEKRPKKRNGTNKSPETYRKETQTEATSILEPKRFAEKTAQTEEVVTDYSRFFKETLDNLETLKNKVENNSKLLEKLVPEKQFSFNNENLFDDYSFNDDNEVPPSPTSNPP
ncbi:Hypothetical predicted protein, partial [Paramuricea clavata]